MQKLHIGLLSAAVVLAVPAAARAEEDRGYLGVFLGPVPEALEHHIGAAGGAIVEELTPGSPAEKAGLRRHDVITAVGGEKLKGPEELKAMIRGMKPGEKVRLSVRRGPEKIEVDAALGSFAAAREAEAQEPAEQPARAEKDPEPEKPQTRRGFFGVGFADVPAILSSHLGLADGSGVVVTDVWKDSPAKKAGVEKDDVLVAVDGYDVKGAEDFARLLSEKSAGEKVKIDYVHKGAKASVEVLLAERPADLPRGGDDPFFHRPFFHPYGPGTSRKGKIILQGPEGGRLWQFDVPDGVWKAERFSRDLELQLKDMEKDLQQQVGKVKRLLNPDVLGRRLKKLTEDLDELKPDGFGPGSDSSTVESHNSVIRIVEGEYDVTVQESNGNRSITVKKGGNTVAENLPWEKLETLPEDVRARVAKAAESFNLKAPPPKKLPQDTKIKA